MNLLEALTWGERTLKETHGEKYTRGHNAKFDAQILLSHTLQKPSSYLFAHFDDPLREEQEKQFRSLIERRKKHEPVAYILEEMPFYGRNFFVDRRVLIPRKETEVFIDVALRALQDGGTVIDVGTGSGALAVTLAAESGAPVVAIDMSADALSVAKENAERHHVMHLISFLQGNLLQPFFEKNIKESTSTVLVANLPYLPLGFVQSLDPDVVDYEPMNALFAGLDGLELYEELLEQLTAHPDVFRRLIVLFEIDPSQKHTLAEKIRSRFPRADIKFFFDLSKKHRFLQATLS